MAHSILTGTVFGNNIYLVNIVTVTVGVSDGNNYSADEEFADFRCK